MWITGQESGGIERLIRLFSALKGFIRPNAFNWLSLNWLVLVAFQFGCSSLPRCRPHGGPETKAPPDPNIESYHVIRVNSDGFLIDLRPHNHQALIKDRAAAQEYLEETLFAGFAKSGKKKILLFVHGGLNDTTQGMQHFWGDYQRILAGEYYPVFVVWPSGWASTYVEHLIWVRQGIKAETAREKAFSIGTVPFVLVADLGRALTRLPLVVANNSKSDVETSTAIRNSDGGAAVRQYQQLVADNYHVTIGDDYSRLSDRSVRAITYWATLPIKYFAASLIDGLGTPAWDNMLRRTQTVYPSRLDDLERRRLQEAQVTQTNMATAQISSGKSPSQRFLSRREEKKMQRYLAAGLPLFMNELQKREGKDVSEVTLVGHSMGSIILNRVVRDSNMNFANIVYMGAACSIADFEDSMLPYLKAHRGTQFYNESLHPVAETGELNNSLFDLPPRGSLLVWIDNFFGNPSTEHDRTFGAWRNLFRSGPTGEPIIKEFFKDDRNGIGLKDRLHFRAFSVGFGTADQLRSAKYQWNENPERKDLQQRCDNPLTHGEFSEMPYWESSFWWP